MSHLGFLKASFGESSWERGRCPGGDNEFMDLLSLPWGSFPWAGGHLGKLWKASGLFPGLQTPLFTCKKPPQCCRLTPDLLCCFPGPPIPLQRGSSGQSWDPGSSQAAFLAAKKRLGAFLIRQM